MTQTLERPDTGLTVRYIPFEFPTDIPAYWIPDAPERSQFFNAISVTIAVFEAYAIKVFRKVLKEIAIEDPLLKAQVQDFCAQEGQHFGHHKRFNASLVRKGYACLPAFEQRLEKEYDSFLEQHSLAWNVAYVAGFETVLLLTSHWLINKREKLFAGSDPWVLSLWFWHLSEEIEHKTVAYDLQAAVGYKQTERLWGNSFASLHLGARTYQLAREFLRHDGRWDLPMKLRMSRWIGISLSKLGAGMLRAALPSYNPRSVEDPPWQKEWIAAYCKTRPQIPLLDTKNLSAPLETLWAPEAKSPG